MIPTAGSSKADVASSSNVSKDTTLNVPIVTINIEETDDELQTLAPPKVVFLSNFAKTSTEEQIRNYIAKRIPDFVSNVLVSKMNLPETRNYASFKLTIRDNEELFDYLLKKDFWPRNTFVKPFLRRAYQATIPM